MCLLQGLGVVLVPGPFVVRVASRAVVYLAPCDKRVITQGHVLSAFSHTTAQSLFLSPQALTDPTTDL
jgi:hypothetical protein